MIGGDSGFARRRQMYRQHRVVDDGDDILHFRQQLHARLRLARLGGLGAEAVDESLQMLALVFLLLARLGGELLRLAPLLFKGGVVAAIELQLAALQMQVGARDLRKCLMLQLERAGKDGTLEYRIIRDHMEALGKKKIPEIARSTGQTVDEVQNALVRIGRLEPRPGRAFLPVVEQYVAPEVFVVKNGDEFTVTTNDEQIPHLRISNVYKTDGRRREQRGR